MRETTRQNRHTSRNVETIQDEKTTQRAGQEAKTNAPAYSPAPVSSSRGGADSADGDRLISREPPQCGQTAAAVVAPRSNNSNKGTFSAAAIFSSIASDVSPRAARDSVLSLTPIKFATAFCVVPFAAQISFNRSFIARPDYSPAPVSSNRAFNSISNDLPQCGQVATAAGGCSNSSDIWTPKAAAIFSSVEMRKSLFIDFDKATGVIPSRTANSFCVIPCPLQRRFILNTDMPQRYRN